MVGRVDPKHYALRESLSSPYPLAQLGALVRTEPDYGLSARAVARRSAAEPRYIRITDFGEDGVEPGHTFVTPEVIESGYDLALGDILFARTGSVGKTYIHEDTSEPAIFAGYCIRFQFDATRALPGFVYWWTKTAAYARWVAAIRRPSVQANINKEEFKSCLIPLPPVARQGELVAAMATARAERRDKVVAADKLLAGLDDFVLGELGIERPAAEGRRVFGVKRGIATHRFDPHFHAPDFVRNAETLSQIHCEPLGSIATFSKEIWRPQDHTAATFRYIEISAVSPQTGQAIWSEVPTLKAPSRARMQVQPGDIIVSLTRPHHGSIALLDDDFEGCIASTGFAVIRDAAGGVLRDYLWCVLRAQFCLRQMLQRASGGNYPAITEEELAKIQVPVPDLETQSGIVAEVQKRHNQAARLRSAAESGWQAAKEWFEGEVLGYN